MADGDKPGGFKLDPEGWTQSIPDEVFVGVIEECTIRDAKFERFERPIRQFAARVRRLDAIGVLEDGTEVPVNRYVSANLEQRRRKPGTQNQYEIIHATKGRNKANHIMTNWIKAGLPMGDIDVPEAIVNGQFVPLPKETWTSPKDGELKSENRIHITALEGIKIKVKFRRRMDFPGGLEARDVMEIVKVLPPDFEVPEGEIERIDFTKREDAGESPPGEGSGNGGAPSEAASTTAAPSTSEGGEQTVIDALDGRNRSEALEVLMKLPETLRTEPYVSGLSGEGQPMVTKFVEEGKLTEDENGNLSKPG